jgi:hypothetical protein
MQEHTADFIIRLLSPPAPAEYSGGESHLIAYAPLLNELILGIASSNNLHIFSLHGLVNFASSDLNIFITWIRNETNVGLIEVLIKYKMNST